MLRRTVVLALTALALAACGALDKTYSFDAGPDGGSGEGATKCEVSSGKIPLTTDCVACIEASPANCALANTCLGDQNCIAYVECMKTCPDILATCRNRCSSKSTAAYRSLYTGLGNDCASLKCKFPPP